MKYTFPHTIESGGGEELTFVRLVENPSGGMLEVENKVQPGSGPPMHIHWLQDESLTVVQGRLGVRIAGQEPTFHGPGESVTFKKGVAHRFWNDGQEVLICKGWVTPANNLVYFLSEIYRSTKANGGHRPSLFDGAYLQTKYQSEFSMLEIPWFVTKVMFPVILLFGKLRGQHRKFEKAPEAVSPGR
jgi:quercetin dioxygenase-like cupin family protein